MQIYGGRANVIPLRSVTPDRWMRLQNKHGTPVDPVPFVVVVLLAALVSYSYGPIYLMELGLDLGDALLACGAVVTASVGVAHHRLVWTARPDHREEIPPGLRLRRLFYAMLIGVAVLALLALPLIVR